MSEYPSRPRIRVGLLLDGYLQPAWRARLIERLKESSFAEISLVVLNDTPTPSARTSFLYRLYAFLDQKIFSVTEDAFAQKDIRSLLEGIPTQTVHPRQTAFSDYIEGEDLKRLVEQPVDVFVRFGFRILRGVILTLAPYGVWSYHHGDARVNRGSPPGFWEVMEGQPVTGSILQKLTEDLDNGVILCRSWSATNRVSTHRSKNSYYWKSVEFVPRVLEELYRDGWEQVLARRPQEAISFYDRPLYTAPKNGQMFVLFCKHAWRVLIYKLDDVFRRDHWRLLYAIGKKDFPSSLWRLKPLHPPRDRFWADPQVISHGGSYVVFFEEYLYAKKKGHVACMEITSDGTCLPSQTVLEEPHHLSYPFVFKYQDTTYMVPESAARGTLDLYRCTHFPHQWTFDRHLMQGVSVYDATLFERDGRWWMFANLKTHPAMSSWDELHLFSAETPFGPWKPHPQNPIVSDVRRARPAGKPFELRGKWYRPAQDCSVRYGGGLRVHEILVLTPETYEERETATIEPAWEKGDVGTHTLSVTGPFIVVDAVKRRFLA